MRVAILSANIGDYEQPTLWPELKAPSGVTLSVHRFTDDDLPPRPLAMTSRLMCGIPKWFGVDYAPTADVILWMDASCVPAVDAVQWWLDRLDGEIAVFAHPERKTIAEEYAFMKTRMARPGETYLTSRYGGEWLDEQYRVITEERCAELPLYASTAFAYRTTPKVVMALQRVFLHKARYLLHDQLAFPYVLHMHGCKVRVIHENYLKCAALTFARKKKAA